MNRFLLSLLLLALTGCLRESVAPTPACVDQASGRSFSQAETLQRILDRYTAEGIPGSAIALISPSGTWTGASGFARLEDRTPMRPCHLQFGQSVAKVYTATAILQLVEAGRMDLDAYITRYLPKPALDQVSQGEAITVRMLLNHTAGVPDYTENPRFVTALLQHPLKKLLPEDLLKYVAGQPLTAEPGSRSQYSNTHYLLLALMADQVSGSHTRLIREGIVQRLGLGQTVYHDTQSLAQRQDVVNSYFDRFGNGRLENVTDWQRTNVASMIGDDGILATPLDFVRFLQALTTGKLVSEQSYRAMTTWVQDATGQPVYGLGLHRMTYNGQIAYGHAGSGIGAGCALYYFPAKQLYLFIGVNLGTITEGPLVRKTESLQNEILDALL